MDDTPKRTWRRWFQFRLTTWLALVGIVAWAMAQRPYYIWHTVTDSSAGLITMPNGMKFYGLSEGRLDEQALNPALRWPALALVAFIG